MKSNNMVFVRWFTLCMLFFVVSIGGFAWWRDATMAVDTNDETPVDFIVQKGEAIREISNRLSNEKLIRSSIGFYITVKLKGNEKNIQAGDFRLFRSMDAGTIAEALTHGTQDEWVTIPEGWRIEEIATLLSKTVGIPEREFLKYAQEGYMFPDTYSIPKDSTASSIAKLFRDTFDTKVKNEFLPSVQNSQLTFEQIIILASIVEREGKSNADRPVIAGILLNRLNEGMPLQVDATLQYALGYQEQEKTWWKKQLFDEDKIIDSPYNTYQNVDLPVGPIANPGIDAIRAVVIPTKTEYMYYLHDTTGGIHYARTLEDHEANIAKYL